MPEDATIAAPLTALAAVEQAAAAQDTTDAATPDAPTPADSPGSATTEQAAVAPPTGDLNPSTTEAPKGPIPFEVHKTALENARVKASEEADTKWRQQYGWAEQIKPEQLHDMATFYERAAQDPVAHVVEGLNDLMAHPQYAAQIRSHAARVLGQRSAAPVQDVDIEPDIPVLDEQGREVTRAFSAEAVKQLVQRELQKAINPLSEDLKTRKAQEIEAERQNQRLEYVSRESERINKTITALPQYDAHKDGIKARIGELAKTDPHSTPGEIAMRAYVDVVFPQLTASAQSQVLDTLKTKAGARMESPSGASATPLKRPTNARELASFMETHSASLR